MSSFLDPLDEPQQLLVDTVWEKFAEAEKFPSFRYVEYVMRLAGYNAEKVLNSFPALVEGRAEYRAAQAYTHRPVEGPVWLTLAGLRHVQDSGAEGIISVLLDYMRGLTKAQEEILQQPFNYDPGLWRDFRKTVRSLCPGRDDERILWEATARVASQEWPGIRFQYKEGGNGNGSLARLLDADFDTVEEYLAAAVASLNPPEQPAILLYTDPRALVRSMGFFDVTCELVIGRPLVARPPLDRSSLLVLNVATEADFLAGLAALNELLGQLDVPKTRKQPPHALGRITDYLVEQLPEIDRHAVERAVDTLDQIRVLRNSNIHTKPDAGLLEAYQSLGLGFPVRDYGAAWDSIRAYADRAFATLQEEIQAARHTPTETKSAGSPAAQEPSTVVPAQASGV